MCAMKRSEKPLWLWSSLIIWRLGTKSSELAEFAVAVSRRIGWPASAPSPRKSPGSSVATIASLPACERHRQADRAGSQINHAVARMPWENTTSPRAYDTTFFPSPARLEEGLCVNGPFLLGDIRALAGSDYHLLNLVHSDFRGHERFRIVAGAPSSRRLPWVSPWRCWPYALPAWEPRMPVLWATSSRTAWTRLPASSTASVTRVAAC